MFYRWVQQSFACDFYVHAGVEAHRSHVLLESVTLPEVDRKTAITRYRKAQYDVVFSHGMFYRRNTFLLSGPSTQLVVLTEPMSPIATGWHKQLIKSMIIKRHARLHRMSILLLGPASAITAFSQPVGKEVPFSTYGYFPDISPQINIKQATQPPIEIVFAGQFIERKNIRAILEAAALSSAVRSGACRITITGAGPLVDLVRQSPHIRYAGFLPQDALHSLLCASDILILPSKYDGWGAIVNEAAACGCMVLLSDQVMASSTFLKEDITGQYISTQGAEMAIHIDALCDKPASIAYMKSQMQTHYQSLIDAHDSLIQKHLEHATTHPTV